MHVDASKESSVAFNISFIVLKFQTKKYRIKNKD